MRAYTLAEIDEMRDCVGRIIDGPGSYNYDGQGGFFSSGFVYNEAARKAEIEDRLRTYMTANLEPEELKARVAEIRQIEADRMATAKAAWEKRQMSAPQEPAKPNGKRGFTWLS